MKFDPYRIVVAVLAVLAIVSFFFGYWPVAIGLAIVVVALLVSWALQARGPRPSA